MGQYDFIALDVETANRSRSSLCAIGLAAVKGGEIVQSGAWLVNPLADFDPYNTLVHGLDAAAVAKAPILAELWSDIGDTLDGERLVAHNAPFDLSVLRSSAARAELGGGPGFGMWCTWRIAKRVWPDLASHGLDYLSKHLGVECDHHDAHSDARACAEIALHLCREQSAREFLHLIELLGLQAADITADSYRPAAYGLRDIAASPKPHAADGDENANQDHPLYGLTVCFTGTLISMERSLASALVTALGANFRNGVSKKVDYLVLGDADYVSFADGWMTGKLDKAIELRDAGHPIEIISERHFLQLLDG